MKTAKINLAIAVISALGFAAAFADDDSTNAPVPGALPPDSTRTGVTYDTDIKPILQANCFKCHSSNGPKKPKAGLSLDSREGALKGSKDGSVITVGDSAHSDLVMAVAHIGDDPDEFMPKGKNPKPLTPEQIGLIRAWIDQGAK